MPLQKNQVLTLRVERLSSDGSGVAHSPDGETVFIPGAAPGDEARVRIVKDCKRYAFGILDEVLTPSPDRIPVDCAVAGPCGGCSLRHLDYAAELRAIHYFEENARTLAQRDALQAGQFAAFAALVLESGRASFALCQNVYCSTDVRHQGLSVALALSQSILQGSTGAWRMQGGGFAGTIQAYVPQSLLERYHSEIERVFGKGSCYILRLREQGAVKVI